MSSHSDARPGVTGAWFLVAGVVIAASVGLVLRSGAGPEEPGLEPLGARGEDRVVVQEPRVAREPISLEVQAVDPYELLAAHWGDQWDQVREQLEAQGKLAGDLPDIRPWTEISAMHQEVLTVTSDGQRDMFYRRLMSWPGLEFDDDPDVPLIDYEQATPAALAKFLSLPELAELDQQQVYLLEQRFADTNARLDGMIRSYMEGLGQVVAHRFQVGQVEHAPLALPQDEAEFYGRPSFFGGSVTCGGWSSNLQLYKDEHPDLAAIKRQIDELRRQRKRELRGFADELLKG